MSTTTEEPTTKEPKTEEPVDELGILVPRKQPVVRKVGKGDEAREYVQRPLGFFQKMRLYEILGEAIDTLATDEGDVLRAVFGSGDRADDIVGLGRNAMMRDADSFLRLIGKLATQAPDLMLDLYVLFLAVPPNEQPWARITMQKSPDEGGLTDEEGIDILEVAIDQNAEAIRSFFVEKLTGLSRRIGAMFPPKPDEESASSKPSRATRRATQKR
jgi:hypothetical protein